MIMIYIAFGGWWEQLHLESFFDFDMVKLNKKRIKFYGLFVFNFDNY